MSYPVRVVVKESVSEVVHQGDVLRLGLCDDPVLRKPGAAELLASKLRDGGWDEVDGQPGVFRKTLGDHVSITWDTEKQELTLEAEAEDCVDQEVELVLRGDSYTRDGREQQEADLRERGKQEIREKLDKQVEAAKTEREAELLRQVQDRLETAVDDARAGVNSVLEGVYRDWLLEQARTLGKVVGTHESVSEDGEVYELTIRVEE
ncbi:MAG: hypothetical protein AB7K09_05760 [Planctomycetota bacterium]